MEARARGPHGIAVFLEDDEPIGSRILWVNDAFARSSGYTVEQLVGHSALLLAGARPSARAIDAARHAAKDRPYVARERRVRPDGTSYLAEVRLERLSGPARDGGRRIVLTLRVLES